MLASEPHGGAPVRQYPWVVTDWGGKVAAWFGVVCVAAGTGALLVWPAWTAARQPSRGWLLVLFITLTAIAAAAFVIMLMTGPLAVWSAWRRRKVRGLPARKIRDCDPYLLGVKRSAGSTPRWLTFQRTSRVIMIPNCARPSGT